MVKKILLADDEPDILKVVTFRLSKAGYELVIAINGQEAVEFAQKHKPDLILMDYRMPIMNGMEACKMIKADPNIKHIPVIFITASSANMTEESVRAIGAYGRITKPFEASDLIERIQKALGGK